MSSHGAAFELAIASILIRVLAILRWLPSYFLASSLARQSLFDPLLLSGLEIKGVFLSFFYDVFLQNLALETPQCVFDGFAIVYLNIRHLISSPCWFFVRVCITPLNRVGRTP